jgi:hypothetical protein
MGLGKDKNRLIRGIGTPYIKGPLNREIRNKNRIAVKTALFVSYATISAANSYPTDKANGRASRSAGLAPTLSKSGHSPKWGWRVEYLWSAWNGWFDSLVGAFSSGGYCMVGGESRYGIAGRAISWLTLGSSLSNRANSSFLIPGGGFFRKHSQEVMDGLCGSDRVFWVILGTTKNFHNWYSPVFTSSGLTARPRRGWSSLPGPMNCDKLNLFILAAALKAYRLGLVENRGNLNFKEANFKKKWVAPKPLTYVR